MARAKVVREKIHFIVNIYDRDMQREMPIETWAVTPKKAVANGWHQLMKIEGFTGSYGVFWKMYGERYVLTVRK
jgi:hypothetical protein